MVTFIGAALALLAFAANSILCRVALRETSIDPATFTSIRLVAGAAVLLLAARTPRAGRVSPASWSSAAWLALYAVPFSFAYLGSTAGTGALLLFGSVQVTMIAAVLWSGERPSVGEWIGLTLALSGLIYLVLPGVTAPPPVPATLMAVAGVSWGIYSLRGRRSPAPLLQTRDNFVRAVPFALAVSALTATRFQIDWRGAALAVVSGAITSGLGYVVWYATLRRLSAVRAAVLQLAVPILAAAGGVLLLGETMTIRLSASAALVLGGIALALRSRAQASGIR